MKNISLVLLVISLYIIGCSEDCTCPEDGDKQKIYIGVLMPETGSGESTGESSIAALNIAERKIDDYYESIGSKYDIDFVFKDSGTDPDMALEHLAFFKEEGVQIVIGPYSSSSVANCKQYADDNDILLVSPASVAYSLAIPGDNVLRLPANDSSQALAMAKIFKYGFDRRVIFPVMRDDVWGNDLYELTKKAYEDLGGEMSEPVKYDPSTQDFSDVVNELDDKIIEFYETAGDKEAGVYMLTFGEGVEILSIADNYTKLSSTSILWYGSSAFTNNKNLTSNQYAASFALSHSFISPIFGLMKDAEYKWAPLQNELRQELGRQPEVYALLAYDALWIGALVYQQVGDDASFDVVKKAFIEEADKYFGASGPTGLDENGDRKLILYDIWKLHRPGNDYDWEKVGQYDGLTNTIDWF